MWLNVLLFFKFCSMCHSCAPLLPAAANTNTLSSRIQTPSVNTANSFQLPDTSFQLDNLFGAVPLSSDYENNNDGSIQKDSIVPLQREDSKLKLSLFDLFRPLTLSKAESNHMNKNPKLNSLISINTTCSPPVHWTFCEPICGVGDQAVDAENSYEIAYDDVVEAIQAACKNMNTKCDVSNLIFQYNPESVLTEQFGFYYDLKGYRYRISGKTVAFRFNSQNPGIVESFSMPILIKFPLVTFMSENQQKKLKQRVSFLSSHPDYGKIVLQIVDYLATQKFLHFRSTSQI